MTFMHLSYDVTVILWITRVIKKSYDHSCNDILPRTYNVIEHVPVNNAFSY